MNESSTGDNDREHTLTKTSLSGRRSGTAIRHEPVRMASKQSQVLIVDDAVVHDQAAGRLVRGTQHSGAVMRKLHTRHAMLLEQQRLSQLPGGRINNAQRVVVRSGNEQRPVCREIHSVHARRLQGSTFRSVRRRAPATRTPLTSKTAPVRMRDTRSTSSGTFASRLMRPPQSTAQLPLGTAPPCSSRVTQLLRLRNWQLHRPPPTFANE